MPSLKTVNLPKIYHHGGLIVINSLFLMFILIVDCGVLSYDPMYFVCCNEEIRYSELPLRLARDSLSIQ